MYIAICNRPYRPYCATDCRASYVTYLGSRPPIAVFYPATSVMCRCGLFASLCVYGSEMGVIVFVRMYCVGLMASFVHRVTELN